MKLLLLAVLLVGCESINQAQILEGEKLCKVNGGVKAHGNTSSTAFINVTCINGATFQQNIK